MTTVHPNLHVRSLDDFVMEPLFGKNPQPVMEAGCRIVKDLGLVYWVSAGTALGFLRDGGFIPHDTDIDVEVLLHWNQPAHNGEVAEGLIERFRDAGLRLIREMYVVGRTHPMQLAFIDPASNIIFDIYFFYAGVRDGEIVNYNDHGLLSQPEHFFETFESRWVEGFDYPFPSPADAYLEMRYGPSWRVPRESKDDWGQDAANLVAYCDPETIASSPASEMPVVGYIDGTFDLFHFGHVNVLRQAHEHCDVLIVGVATRQLCEGAKNLETVMSFEERRAVVEACRYADLVVEHRSLDESDLVRAQEELSLTINKHLVGADFGCWGDEQVKRLEWCVARGVETVQLRRTPNISTTEIKLRLVALSKPDTRV